MASNKAKLSLRRHKKPPVASQPRQDTQPPVSHMAAVPLPDPPPTGAAAITGRGGEGEGGDNGGVCDSVIRDSGERVGGGAELNETEDFRPLRKNGRKRKGRQYDPTR